MDKTVKYSEEFIKRAKAYLPNDLEFHDALDAGNVGVVGRALLAATTEHNIIFQMWTEQCYEVLCRDDQAGTGQYYRNKKNKAKENDQ